MKVRDNFRVVIDVDRQWSFARNLVQQEEVMESRAKDIIKDVKRHVDGVESVYIETDFVCEFCGYGWEVDETGMPQCCQKAIDEWEGKRAAIDAEREK